MTTAEKGVGYRHMIIKWKGGETPFITLPRDESLFIKFLTLEGFEPLRTSDREITINKEIFHDDIRRRWETYSGLKKTTDALVERFKLLTHSRRNIFV